MDLIKESRKLAISEIQKYGSPNLIHFEISEKKALELAKKINSNKTVVLAGVYLMDLKLGQALKKNRVSQHVQMSIQVTKKFLRAFRDCCRMSF